MIKVQAREMRHFPSCRVAPFLPWVMIAEETTEADAETARASNGLVGQLLQLISYLVLCGWLVWITITEKSESELVATLDQIIFVDFFGYFLISILFSGDAASVRWKWPLCYDEGLKIVGYLVLILFAGWFMEGLAGWWFTISWMVGIAMSLSDVSSLRSGALVRVVWGIVSAFLVALVASIKGVPEEQLLENVSTLLGWALLYFGGVAIFRFVRILSMRGE